MTRDELEGEIHAILGMRAEVIQRTRALIDRLERALDRDDEEVGEYLLGACCVEYFQLVSTGDVLTEIASENNVPVEFIQKLADELPEAWKVARMFEKLMDVVKGQTEEEWPEVVQEKVEISEDENNV